MVTISSIQEAQLEAQQEPRPNKFFGEVQKAIAPVKKTVKRFTVVQAAFAGASNLLGSPIDPNQVSWLAGAKLIAAVDFLLSIPKLIWNIQLALYAKTTVEKIQHIATTIITAGSMAGASATVIEALKNLGWIAKETLPWSGVASYLFLPLQVLALELEASKITVNYKLKNELLEALHVTENPKARKRQIQDLTKACHYIIENRQSIQKSLVISKKEAIDQRAQLILEKIGAKNKADQSHAISQAKALTDTLKSRVSLKYNFSIAAGVTKVAALAVSAVSLAFLSITLGWIALGAVASISLAVYIAEKCMFKKHNVFA